MFGPCLLRPNGCMDQMPLGTEVGIGPDSQFSAHVYCGQIAGWIKVAIGMEVPHCARLGHSSPSPKRDRPQIFGPCLLWPNGWMDSDATWYRSRPRPRPRCIRRGPSFARERSTAAPLPLCGPCLLWPRSPISATAELLLWSPYGIGQTLIYFHVVVCSFFFFFPRPISASADWMSAILPHMVWP